MNATERILLLPEPRLRALLEEAIERASRRVLKDAIDPAVADRPGFGFVTNAEAMEALGLSRATLARYRRDGKLLYSRVGSSVYYRREDIEALVDSNRVQRD